MEVPVYLFTGFLESGKTGFIKDTIQDPNFSHGEKTLIILCEEGLEEFDETFLKENGASIVIVESEEKFTGQFLKDCSVKYDPERVFIELNGTWDTKKFLNMSFPKYWEVIQIITLINGETYQSYMNNMRSMLVNHYTDSDMVIFNRCTNDMDRAAFRRSVKAVNRKAQVYFEGDELDSQDTSELLPFDLNAEIIEIEDDDYGIWYIDAMDHPEKYKGKTISFTALVYKPKQLNEGLFVPGRHAMTCCADDVSFIGFICKSQNADKLKHRQWIKITAEVRIEYREEYKGKGPVLYAKKIAAGKKPEEDLVYFY
ncbi:putative repeat protein (TIGR03943 family) [Lachnotalea glycerini]|uniref:GTPase n=1 Tax=Lachnotalea glycerini TaxID=1763509 RepID=A0A255IMD7_9FIRM|nr:GTP-binding protein [Lachnotalea glycerini]PXV85666.1 putative repeat protein (TIGR03943 family) [Lachnotalea glycerini]RDY31344.1 GTPase [Lachnotalea glycerini]